MEGSQLLSGMVIYSRSPRYVLFMYIIYMCIMITHYSQINIGKPFGWVTSSEGRFDNVSFTHIGFPVQLATSNVSITYLASYQNSGIMEVWVSANKTETYFRDMFNSIYYHTFI
jgi:hypothetical protein